MIKDEKMEVKALDIESFVEDYFIDPHGVVYTMLDQNTKRPASKDFYTGANERFSGLGISLHDLYTHENCGMCTGAYMQSMICKYRCTGGDEALMIARRCLKALKHIYDLGKQREKGFFPKIYAGRFSNETSSDQVLYAVSAMDNFYDLADDSEKKIIEEMIPAMIEFWVKNDYCVSYFYRENMLWPLDRFPALLLLASRYSNREIFKKEYERLLPLTEYTSCSRLRKKIEGEHLLSEAEKARNAYFIYTSADALTMSTMQYDLLLRYDPDNAMRDKWLMSLKQMWDESRLMLVDNGYCYTHAYIDIDTGKVSRTPGYAVDGSSEHGAESAWSTMIIRGAVQLSQYFPEERTDIAKKLLCVLTQLDVEDMCYYRDTDADRFAPDERFKTGFLSGDAIANWLWAYWLGRLKRLI